MSTFIAWEMLSLGADETVREVLAGEFAGAACFLHRLPAAGAYAPAPSGRVSRVFFFLAGKGLAECGGSQCAIAELAVFAPGHLEAAVIRAQAPLTFLEVALELQPGDLEWAARQERKPPWFASYSSCRTYREAIKSAKCVNRTLLPVAIVPRFCAGSVQTAGPDRVAAHRHGMLDQLFLGLAGNDGCVQTDGASCPFGADMLLHIPPGSEHGVTVEAGKALHYIWLDRFQSEEGTSWIAEQHVDN